MVHEMKETTYRHFQGRMEKRLILKGWGHVAPLRLPMVSWAEGY